MASGARWQNRASPSPRPASAAVRPMSMVLSPTTGPLSPSSQTRNHSFSPLSGSSFDSGQVTRQRSNSNRNSNSTSSTFAPTFIKTQELHGKSDEIGGIEGENDFSGKRYVWLRDPGLAFVKGWIVDEMEDGRILVQCDDGSVRSSSRRPTAGKLTSRSSERLIGRVSTKSIRQSSTKLTTWRNSRI